MTEVAVCTDSSSLLTPAAAAALEVDVVPVAVALDGEPFDGEANLEDFYERMRGGAIATTSQPSPGDFAVAYGQAATRGAQEILSIHLDARVSGTASSAKLAAQETELRVLVVSVPTVSFGVAVCVRSARQALVDGADAREAADVAMATGSKLDNAFAARAVTGGRVAAAPREWTLLRFADGVARPLSRHGSDNAAVQALARHVQEASRQPAAAAVGHASEQVEASADALAEALDRSGTIVAVERYRVGAAVGAHTGPDGFGAFWWPAG
jgi:DegV family protein with EDD domain